jgi:hypothetical protein
MHPGSLFLGFSLFEFSCSSNSCAAGVAITNEALKVGVQATQEGKDNTGFRVDLTASLTLLCQGADPAGKGRGG